jgi:hypothetical protein
MFFQLHLQLLSTNKCYVDRNLEMFFQLHLQLLSTNKCYVDRNCTVNESHLGDTYRSFGLGGSLMSPYIYKFNISYAFYGLICTKHYISSTVKYVMPGFISMVGKVCNGMAGKVCNGWFY